MEILHGIAFNDLFSNLCDLDPKAHAAIDKNKLKDDWWGHQRVRENSSLLEDPTHLSNTQRCQDVQNFTDINNQKVVLQIWKEYLRCLS